MRKLEELGITESPWRFTGYTYHKDCAWYKWREALIAASGHETACEI